MSFMELLFMEEPIDGQTKTGPCGRAVGLTEAVLHHECRGISVKLGAFVAWDFGNQAAVAISRRQFKSLGDLGLPTAECLLPTGQR